MDLIIKKKKKKIKSKKICFRDLNIKNTALKTINKRFIDYLQAIYKYNLNYNLFKMLKGSPYTL